MSRHGRRPTARERHLARTRAIQRRIREWIKAWEIAGLWVDKIEALGWLNDTKPELEPEPGGKES